MVGNQSKLAVICHGDLWWSNVLFKYDSDTAAAMAVPVEVKFIDFQSSRVASLGKGHTLKRIILTIFCKCITLAFLTK